MSTAETIDEDHHLVTMSIGATQFGVPVLSVRDVLDSPTLYPVPLAPGEIAGSINLRGRIVTAIDLRTRLGLPPREAGRKCMCVIVEMETTAEPYAFLVDEVGDVLTLSPKDFEPTPITLSKEWARLTRGLYRQPEGLLLRLDARAVLEECGERAA